MVDVCLVQVPYMAGDDRHGSSDGPRCLVAAGAAESFIARGVGVTVVAVDRGEPFSDTASSSAQVNRRLAAAVGSAVGAGQVPVVLAGSCTACMGVVGGFDHAGCGAVWLDAHADFNTPDSTVSGFFPGMSLAVITGHCYRNYWSQIGDSTPLAEETVALFGVRDVSPDAERQRLERSRVEVVEWCDGRPRSDPIAPLERLAQHVRDVYLHIDFDAFSPDVAPGVADRPVPGGLSIEDAASIIAATGRRFRIRAATLATYTPALDQNDKTLRTGLRLLDAIRDALISNTDEHTGSTSSPRATDSVRDT
ncbi:MAG TPA: arginase family protein [Acidimicrobiales bacterium]|nr:arginase family protein [Acidimicrobiales bacterium]